SAVLRPACRLAAVARTKRSRRDIAHQGPSHSELPKGSAGQRKGGIGLGRAKAVGMLSSVERPSAICFGDTSLAIRTSEDYALPMHCDDGGSHMKKPFVALLLLIGAVAMLAGSAFAQSDDLGIKLVNAKMAKELMSSRASRLGSSSIFSPDTVYVGKSFTNHTGPGNYWNIYVGDYLPGTLTATNAFWDWDNSVGIQAADSLHGWWPVHRQYNSTGGLTLSDDQRPWWAIDHGNEINYVISQQSSAKRTFGIVGLWHGDPGTGLRWSPISGAKSAWCGLRQHGDLTVSDLVTGNPVNQDAAQYFHDGATNGTI